MKSNSYKQVLLEEAMCTIFRERPAIGIEAAWQAYTNDELTLAEASAVVGVAPRQFLEIGSRRIHKSETAIPKGLTEKCNHEEHLLLTYLNTRQIELLARLLDKDLLFPASKAFMSSLWEDLHLCEALNLVEVQRRDQVWQYSLNLGKNK